MHPPRIYSPTPLRADHDVTLSGDPARHLGKVLRLRPGAPVILFDGSGGEYRSIIRSIGKSSVTVHTEEFTDRDVESNLDIKLLQCVSRGERMDFIVQKATELGVNRITPMLSEFSVVKLTGDRAKKRVEHWRKVAASACEQCGRNTLPVVESPVPLLNWFGDQQNSSANAHLILVPGAANALAVAASAADSLVLLIGPEGGFSETELAAAQAAGFTKVSLGPRILRTETAAIAALSALQTLFGDLGPAR